MQLRRILGHLITCKRAAQLVSQEQDHVLGPVNGLLLRLHLAWCVACLRFQTQARFLRRAMQRYRE
jgi:hypothetical protein